MRTESVRLLAADDSFMRHITPAEGQRLVAEGKATDETEFIRGKGWGTQTVQLIGPSPTGHSSSPSITAGEMERNAGLYAGRHPQDPYRDDVERGAALVSAARIKVRWYRRVSRLPVVERAATADSTPVPFCG